jgi:hypothetical protein
MTADDLVDGLRRCVSGRLGGARRGLVCGRAGDGEALAVIRAERIIGNCRLLLGDCRDELPLLTQCKVFVTDPPYGIGYITNHRKHLATPSMLENDAYPPLWAVPLIAESTLEGGACTFAHVWI